MTIEDFTKQFNIYKDRIAKVKEMAFEKKVMTRNDINKNFSIKFEELLFKFGKQINKDEEIHDDILKLVNEKKEEKYALKKLNKEIVSLSKRKRKDIKQKFRLIEREKNKAIDIIRKKIMLLHKKIKLLKARKFAKKWKKWSNL